MTLGVAGSSSVIHLAYIFGGDFMETKICSKCGIEKPVSEFHKNGFNSKGEQKYRGYCKVCANRLESERYYKKKEYINSQKEQCAKCGETRQYVLDYHHRDPSKKDFTICKYRKGSIELLQQEIDKCVVLCSNCHREFHFLEAQDGLTLDEYLAD